MPLSRVTARWLSDTSNKLYFTSTSRDFRKIDVCVHDDTSTGASKTLIEELSNVWSLSSETFNGVSLFGSSAITVQVSEDGTQTVSITGADLANSSTGVGALTASSITSLSQLTGVAEVTGAIQNVATLVATNGALQARLGFASQVLTTNQTNLEAATSQISDVDVAQESTQLARWNVLVQAGTSMLAQKIDGSTTNIAFVSSSSSALPTTQGRALGYGGSGVVRSSRAVFVTVTSRSCHY